MYGIPVGDLSRLLLHLRSPDGERLAGGGVGRRRLLPAQDHRRVEEERDRDEDQQREPGAAADGRRGGPGAGGVGHGSSRILSGGPGAGPRAGPTRLTHPVSIARLAGRTLPGAAGAETGRSIGKESAGVKPRGRRGAVAPARRRRPHAAPAASGPRGLLLLPALRRPGRAARPEVRPLPARARVPPGRAHRAGDRRLSGARPVPGRGDPARGERGAQPDPRVLRPLPGRGGPAAPAGSGEPRHLRAPGQGMRGRILHAPARRALHPRRADGLAAGRHARRTGGHPRRERVEVIFASGPPFTAHWIARRLADRTGLPLVLDFRDPWTRAPFYPRRPGAQPRASTSGWSARACGAPTPCSR